MVGNAKFCGLSGEDLKPSLISGDHPPLPLFVCLFLNFYLMYICK